MQTLVYGFALVATSFVMGLFGFFVGRCARKLPVIDDARTAALSGGIDRTEVPVRQRASGRMRPPLSRSGGRSGSPARRPRGCSRR